MQVEEDEGLLFQVFVCLGVDLGVLVAGFREHPGHGNAEGVVVLEGPGPFGPETGKEGFVVGVGAPSRTRGERRVKLLDNPFLVSRANPLTDAFRVAEEGTRG